MHLERQKDKQKPLQNRFDLTHKIGKGAEVTREILLKAVRLMDYDSDTLLSTTSAGFTQSNVDYYKTFHCYLQLS